MDSHKSHNIYICLKYKQYLLLRTIIGTSAYLGACVEAHFTTDKVVKTSKYLKLRYHYHTTYVFIVANPHLEC